MGFRSVLLMFFTPWMSTSRMQIWFWACTACTAALLGTEGTGKGSEPPEPALGAWFPHQQLCHAPKLLREGRKKPLEVVFSFLECPLGWCRGAGKAVTGDYPQTQPIKVPPLRNTETIASKSKTTENFPSPEISQFPFPHTLRMLCLFFAFFFF